MTILRVGAVIAAVCMAAASSSSNRSYRTSNAPPNAGRYTPPPSEPMDPQKALGLYRSSFGPVKLEYDPDAGPPQVHGVWVYEREGQEVIGYFSGELNGNVLEFSWQEPAEPEPLQGEGFLVFHSDGTGFYGKWWTARRDRSGDWTGQKFVPGEDEADDAPPPEPEPEYTDDYGETI